MNSTWKQREEAERKAKEEAERKKKEEVREIHKKSERVRSLTIFFFFAFSRKRLVRLGVAAERSWAVSCRTTQALFLVREKK